MTVHETLGRMMDPGDTLKLRCAACGHAVTWSRARAFKVMGVGLSPLQIRQRVKCSRCGERGRVDVWI